jgi:hypothetical protein
MTLDFTDAIRIFEADREREEAASQDRFEAAETYLLTTPPRSPSEARAVLAALHHNVATGPRDDGADLVALRALGSFLDTVEA